VDDRAAMAAISLADESCRTRRAGRRPPALSSRNRFLSEPRSREASHLYVPARRAERYAASATGALQTRHRQLSAAAGNPTTWRSGVKAI